MDTSLRLKGTENYEIWSLRIRSLLTKEACADFLKLEGDESTSKKAEDAFAILRLVYDDGPLLQVRNLMTPQAIWAALEKLYSP